MNIFITMLILFLVKLLDSFLLGSKTLLIIRRKIILASITMCLSTFVFLSVVTSLVSIDTITSKVIVSIASGIGLYLANIMSDYFKNDRKRYYEITINENYFRKLLNNCEKYDIVYIKSTRDFYLDKIHVQFLSKDKEQSKRLHELTKNYYGTIVAKNLADYEDYSNLER